MSIKTVNPQINFARFRFFHYLHISIFLDSVSNLLPAQNTDFTDES